MCAAICYNKKAYVQCCAKGDPDMQTLVLIDGNSLLNRAYYATGHLSTKDGTPTNAVFGFVKLLFKLIDTFAPV